MIRLTHMEYEVAGALALAGEPIEPVDIASRIYGSRDAYAAQAVRTHVHNIRKKLGRGAIRTRYQGGYILDREAFLAEGIALPAPSPLDVYPRAGGFVELRAGSERLVLSVAEARTVVAELERRRLLA